MADTSSKALHCPRVFSSITNCLWCGSALQLPPPKPALITRDWRSGDPQIYVYMRCMDCNSLVLINPPIAEQQADYYPSDYIPYQAHPEIRSLGPLQLPCQDELSKVDESEVPMQILDYGPGSGFWLHQAGLTFPRAVCQAVDFDVATTRQRLVWLDRPVEVMTPDQFLGGDLRWHLINFSHSLEHLPNPIAVLSHAISQLFPGGLLVIHCPSIDSLSLRVWGGFWQGFEAPLHLSIPSRRFVAGELQRGGLTILEQSTYGGPGSLRQTLRVARSQPAYARRFSTRILAGVAEATCGIWTFRQLTGLLGLGTSFLLIARRPPLPADQVHVGP